MFVQKCPNFIEKTGIGNKETDCETDEEIESNISGKVAANTKFISEYFNIDEFAKHPGSMDFIGCQPTSTLLFWGVSRMQTYTVQKNKVNVFSQRFMDLSNFSFFNFADNKAKTLINSLINFKKQVFTYKFNFNFINVYQTQIKRRNILSQD